MNIVRASWWGTVVFAVSATAAVLVPEPLFQVPALLVAVGLFLAGCAAFIGAYARAVSRSRRELISVADVYFLAGGVAPPDVRRALLAALALQVAVALGTAIARPYTSLAAGTLVPIYGLGLCGLWGARHGAFQPRPPPE